MHGHVFLILIMDVNIKTNKLSLQKDEERQAQIDYENKLLLTKMTTIMKYGGNLDNYNNYEIRRFVLLL